MILRLTHETAYAYVGMATESHNEVRLMPLTDEDQSCLEFRITVTPAAKVFSYEEPGGAVHHFGIRRPHDSLRICAEALVETRRANPFAGLELGDARWNFYRACEESHAEFLSVSPYVVPIVPAVELARTVRTQSDGSILGFLRDLSRRLKREFSYDPDVTHVHTHVSEVFQAKAGVCQDFAHAMLACLRSQGMPCRYVSGYLLAGDGIRGEQATHAWIECLLPSGRWIGIDPTNDLLANDHYIKVHWGRDYSDVSPTRGVYVGFRTSRLDVSVRVQKAYELAA